MPGSETNVRLIETFYDAFARCDGDAMASCYDSNVKFSDPVFPDLRGDRASAMWCMLTGRSKDLELTYGSVRADERSGSARWEAHYTFGATGRRVHNIIEAKFTFANGLITTHVDDFDFQRWARMALGPVGWLLGWTQYLQRSVQTKAGVQLERYIEKTWAKRSRSR